MSAKSSTSPALHLQIGSSPAAVCLLLLLALLAACALWQLCLAGHYALAIILLLPAVHLFFRLAEAARTPPSLAWRAGQWYVLSGGCEHAVKRLQAVMLPWVVFVALRMESGREKRSLWIFSDALDRESLRALRVRLLLSS